MTLLAIEGFDHYLDYAGVNASDVWSLSGTTCTLPAGRFGGQCLQFTDATNDLDFAQPTNTNEGIIGFAFRRMWSLDSSAGNDSNVVIYDSNGNINLSLYLQHTGLIYVIRNAGAGDAFMGQSMELAYGLDKWAYVEFKFKVLNTGGYIEVRINGQEVINETGLDTAYSQENWKTVKFNGSNQVRQIDDIYIADDSTGTVTDFLGDVRVETLYPSAESSIAWTPSTGTDNSTLVDDPRNDTEYVTAASNGLEDLYDFDNLDTDTDSVYGVSITAVAKKDDSGTRTLGLRSSSGSNQQTSPDKGLNENALSYHSELLTESDSGGSTIWTPALVNAAKFGMKVTS